jgi:hypothetical protein
MATNSGSSPSDGGAHATPGGTWGAGGTGVLEEIGEEECFGLLAGEELGRLVVSGSPPQVFPVNYVLDGRAVVIRTAAGTKLDAVRRDAEVAFEVDGVDRPSRSGWSVVVSGRVREEVHLHDDRSRPQPLPWSEGVRAYWLRLEPTGVSGRRVRPGPGS